MAAARAAAPADLHDDGDSDAMPVVAVMTTAKDAAGRRIGIAACGPRARSSKDDTAHTELVLIEALDNDHLNSAESAIVGLQPAIVAVCAGLLSKRE